MIHLGDIKNMKGETTPIVDVVTGGSPCQDLSVAGKRAGMAGERSGLFMEQIRLIKEMREYDRTTNRRTGIFIRPRFMVWENVPGAFSSNNGEDFRAVLEETAKIADPNAVIPRPAGRWSKAGCVLGDGWSIAWRVHDAQFWGVPQRRKRISLIADFGGGGAPEILFERKSVSGDFKSSGTTEKETSRSPQDGIGGAISFQERAGCDGGGKGILIQKERTGALSTLNNQSVLAGCDVYNHAITGDVSASLTAASGGTNTSGPKIMILNDQGGGIMSVTQDKTATLRAQEHGHPPIVYDMPSFCMQGNVADRKSTQNGTGVAEEVAFGLNCVDRHVVCAGFDGKMGAKAGNIGYEENKAPTLNAGKEMHIVYAVDQGAGKSSASAIEEKSPTLATTHGGAPAVAYRKQGHPQNAKQGQGWEETEINDSLTTFDNTDIRTATAIVQPQPAFGLDRASYNQGKNAKFGFSIDEEKIGAQTAKGPGAVMQTVAPTLKARDYKGIGFQDEEKCVPLGSVVRRLTPMECERLQGFPDNWTNIGEWVDSKGKRHKDADSPRYKALGNSIALPYWFWLLRRISAQYERPATLGSLFDGIGGFPLCWERCNGKGTAIWASEIEEFPIAVTKYHFPE